MSFPDRLQAFFHQADGRFRPTTSASRRQRLQTFFRKAHARLGRKTRPEPKPGVRVDAGQLQAMLAALRGPLAAARADGTFLNAWTAAGLKRDEVRNSSVLATLFDPRLCGDQARFFLSAFLRRLRGAGTSHFPTADELAQPYTVVTEACPLGSADNRVDLSIEGATFLLVVEIKIDAGEGDQQLGRYVDVAMRKAQLLGKGLSLVFLSPRLPAAPPAAVVHATWRDVTAAARQVSRSPLDDKQAFKARLLDNFAAHVAGFH